MQKDLEQLARRLRQEGYTVERTNKRHLVIRHPRSSKPIYGPSTPSDHRSIRNLEAKIRRDRQTWAPELMCRWS